MQGELENDSSLRGSGAMPLDADDPRRIGAFRLLGVLGSGGMGRVYLGAVPGTYAAVKRVLPTLAEDKDFLSHFGHELDNLARLPAGASTKLLASDRLAKPPWFATEFIPGVTLNDALRLNNGPLPADALWRLLREAAAALRTVHAAEMVHRDLKPSNVMLTGSGLSLIDFGVARAADQSRLTKTGMIIGTPAYMAPEQAVADKQLTGAADVFALGSLVLYAANGRPPFGDGSGHDLLYRVVHGEPDFGRLAETDPDLADLVRTCLAKDPEDRPTATELVGHADARAAGVDWPEPVTARIAARTAFAAGAPTAEALAELEAADPSKDVATAPLTPQPPVPPPADTAYAIDGRPTDRPGHRRRNRIVMMAVPVVITTGTTLTLTLGPYELGRAGAEGRPSASPTAVLSPSVQPPSSAAPGAKPSPSSAKPSATKPSAPAGSTPPGAPPPPPPADGGGAVTGGGGGGSSTTTGGGGSGGTSSSGGSTGTSGGTTSGGSASTSGGSTSGGSSSTSGGTTTTRPTTTAPRPTTAAPKPTATSGGGGSGPSGTYSLENATSGNCLAENDQGYAVVVNVMACGSKPETTSYAWTYRSNGDGTFRLVNKRSGKCLQFTSAIDASTAACNGASNQSWKFGTSTSSGRQVKNVGSGQCLTSSTFVIGYACQTSYATQFWRNIGALS
ncbi:serine/threonine-protein kinase [Streptomyces sp. NRRL F-5727]|uniref:serine/threonine-protein kinase n=1 Tax=Streptomyces sp. NRRL F-5727 TaxID=1463871 RepID=UPI000565B4B1|nr:serine/threonine-protein kinase [Streptomyces sp. NRRL F-5727]